jgi:predicted outer membrane repeat protein
MMQVAGAALSLRSLTLANRYVTFSTYGGGAIYSSGGSINITNCTVIGNSAAGASGGGAIFSGGPIFVTDSAFTHNRAHASPVFVLSSPLRLRHTCCGSRRLGAS